MNDIKLIELAQKISERSGVSPNLYWEKTPSEDEFQATLSKFVIQISRLAGRQSVEPDYYLNILDKDGTVLESLSDAKLTEMLRVAGLIREGYTGYTILESIFTKAKRGALGLEKAIDSIISELDTPL
jgi:hypothetical protein